jgi:hypothetical protein
VEVPRLGAHRIVAQVLEEEEDTPDAAWLVASVTFPLHLSKGLMPSVVFGLYFLLSSVFCLSLFFFYRLCDWESCKRRRARRRLKDWIYQTGYACASSSHG